jgi:hydroxymethylbilane synthase
MRIGTRGSALALTQAAWVAERLGMGAEIVTVSTAGDRAAAETDKARWVSELERALVAREIDLAVHSAKDVPGELADGLELVAIPEREAAVDAICGASSLAALPSGARVGTSSLRRAAQIRAGRADLQIVAVRGNVDTRLRKLAEGQADALVLALAGLRRLGREHEAGGVLDELVPAAGQGALALEARAGDAEVTEAVRGLADPTASACVSAERELVRALGASCNTAVGAHATLLEDGRLELRGWVGVPDGSAWLADRLTAAAGSHAGLGLAVGERMLAAGASELLRAAEATS